MRFLLIGVAALVSYAQDAAVVVQPGHLGAIGTRAKQTTSGTGMKATIAVPTLGYLLDDAAAGLVPIEGNASAPSFGDVLPKPGGVSKIYLPPRQHFALVDVGSSNGMAVWHLARRHTRAGEDVLDAISGVNPKPGLLAFSPTGKAVALYSKTRGRVQVFAGLPGTPMQLAEIPTGSLDDLATVSVSDDGKILFATTVAGWMALSSDSSGFHAMPWTYVPAAASFIANSHSLLISDARQHQLILLEKVEASSGPPVVLATDIQPDRLTSCSHGDTVLALDRAKQTLFEIDVNTLRVTPVSLNQQADRLVVLRDGHTVLLATSPMYLVRVEDSPEPALTRLNNR